MKKLHKDLKDKNEKELAKIALDLDQEIAKLQLDLKANPVKDTNLLAKKRERLAVVLTLINISHSK